MISTGYILKTALRDSRKEIGKLLMFMASIVLGIAALVAINSFNYNLVDDIDNQAASLLGADLHVEDNKPISEELLKSIDSISTEEAAQYSTLTMAFLPDTEETQFVNVKALEGAFPFYGKILTEPSEAIDEIRKSEAVVLDKGMALQYELRVGDTVRIGEAFLPIIGILESPFGGSTMSGAFAPTIYISKKTLDKTNLVQPGSLVDYQRYYQVAEDINTEEWRKAHRKQFRDEGVRIESIDSRKEDLSEAFGRLNSFLNLIALVSLLLGCIGVASSVMIYIKTKRPSIAVFRCLGMKSHEVFSIYFFQIFFIGLVGVICGVLLGSIIQKTLPIIFSDMLPYQVEMHFSPRAILEGLIIGLVMTSLFAMGPLLTVREISPLQTLRVDDHASRRRWSLQNIAISSLIVLTLTIYLRRLSESWRDALVMMAALMIMYFILLIISKLTIFFIKRFFPRHTTYVVRQGLSNLFRPNNQTETLILTIGIGTTVLTTLFIVQGLLLQNVAAMDAGNQPNTILYGIETDQKEELREITKSMDLPIIQDVPIVTMALDGWKGKSKKEWMKDTTRTAKRWAINREARVTFRDTLTPEEVLVEGDFTGHINPGDSIFISLATGWAEDMDVTIGDELVWNIQGMRMTTYVGSLRKIEFNSMSTRFFILFPTGVLERAPQFHVLVTKTPDTQTTAKYRSSIVQAFPNVSVLDLGSILTALNDILSKISYVVKFMAGFSILTGLIVLLASLLLSKYQRIKESVLLRTIGASRNQIFKINATEYAVLGALSSATGILLALVASYLIATTQLELAFKIQWLPILGVFVFITMATTIIGLMNSRDVIRRSPLEVLRSEG